MSDVGLYDAIEAEILSKIGTPSGVVTVAKTLSVDDLINRNGIAKPAVGIICTGMRRDAPLATGQSRFYATTTWQIAVAIDNLAGAVNSRTTIYNIFELVRSTLHYQTSAHAPGRYLAMNEEWPEQQPEGRIVGVANYELQVLLGS